MRMPDLVVNVMSLVVAHHENMNCLIYFLYNLSETWQGQIRDRGRRVMIIKIT